MRPSQIWRSGFALRLGCEKARIIAAGANMARALRQQALAEMNHPAQWIKASGYWLKGGADTVENYDR